MNLLADLQRGIPPWVGVEATCATLLKMPCILTCEPFLLLMPISFVNLPPISIWLEGIKAARLTVLAIILPMAGAVLIGLCTVVGILRPWKNSCFIFDLLFTLAVTGLCETDFG